MTPTVPYGMPKFQKLPQKKKATIRFHLYDILRENESSERSISENSITDRESSTYNVYFYGIYCLSVQHLRQQRKASVNTEQGLLMTESLVTFDPSFQTF